MCVSASFCIIVERFTRVQWHQRAQFCFSSSSILRSVSSSLPVLEAAFCGKKYKDILASLLMIYGHKGKAFFIFLDKI